MKTNFQRNVVQGDLGGQRVAMQFDANSIAHIMGILTDLYKDSELAVIREYSTNALDSHIEAGNPDPIQISLPTPLSPNFRVRDFGIGMSPQDIEDIYSKYGASTKRGTNEQTGMLGLGCKSALTYTNQFTLVAVKGGVKTKAVITRIEDGTGVIEIVDTRATDEPNGVEIIIPAKHATSFHQKAKEFFRFWKPGTVLLNGQEPEYITGKYVEDMLIVDNLQRDYIVMGNVPYPLDDRFSSYISYGQGAVAWVKMGDVNFTPSREGLLDTKLTKTTIANLKQRFADSIVKAAQDDINAAPNHGEAWLRHKKWKATLRREFKYKGEVIPTQFDGKGYTFDLNAYRHVVSSTGRQYDNYIHDTSAFVVGFEKGSISTTDRKKTRKYVEDNDLQLRLLYFCAEPWGQPWLQGLKQINWEDIKDVKLSTAPRQTNKGKKQPFRVYTEKGFVDETVIPDGKILYSSQSDSYILAPIQKLFPNHKIVLLTKNRWPKFLREHPSAKEITEALKELEKPFKDALTAEDKIVLGVEHRDKYICENLKATEIEDPEVKRFVAAVNQQPPSPTYKAYKDFIETCEKAKIRFNHMFPKAKSPFKVYPLLNNYYGSNAAEHKTEYINAVYRLRKEKENT